MKVLVIDTIAPEGIAYLAERGFEVDQVSSKLPKDELHGRLGDYEAIVTRSSTTVTPEFLGRARRLRCSSRSPTSPPSTARHSRGGFCATTARSRRR